ncbi:hypothetical protein MGEO_10305 [Marivita geojedonensis]|uniref:Uncharacterized protein n=1 Tax=Marivita geojedonensis TaxID=1123756 RepID=A0A1X4NKV4_9RHOB|nr:hypothetical protein MGEO_10305 [Marivita geojedonensis]PRY77485.1 hypothetical protein CLV76_108108 [Marivita geojedonensis]
MPEVETLDVACHEIGSFKHRVTAESELVTPIPCLSPLQGASDENRSKVPLKRLFRRFALTRDQADRLAQIKFPCC